MDQAAAGARVTPPANRPAITRLSIGAASVKLISSGDRVCDHVAKGAAFEPQTRRLWGAWCAAAPKQSIVLDIGAYAGVFSLGAALLGLEPWAFEPMPFNAERLSHNATINKVAVRLFTEAVSDRDGEARIGFNATVPFTAGASLLRKKGAGMTVRTLAIDSLNLASCALVKIDVERAETLVLAGMTKTLARFKPNMIIEALGEDERSAVLKALPDYICADIIDVRNMVMLPK